MLQNRLYHTAVQARRKETLPQVCAQDYEASTSESQAMGTLLRN